MLGESQVGELATGDIAGNNIIHNTFNFADPEAGASHFADGLSALLELIGHSPAVRAAVAVFQEQLHDARLRVRELITLKLLHDLLHGIQYQHLPLLMREARRFPDDEFARASIEDSILALDRVNGEIDSLIREGFVSEQSVRWRVVLRTTAIELQTALDTNGSVVITRAIHRLASVITTEPSFINANLHTKANDLRLARLIESLRDMYERLSALAVAPRQLERVKLGTAGLIDLNQHLTGLISEHNDWQIIDRELRRIESTLRQDTIELEFSWPDLRLQVATVCAGSDAWSLKIRQQGERLDQLLAAHRIDDIRNAFDRLQSYIGHQFYDVDSRLKQLCGRLRDFRNPLNALEEALQ
jgi:hypothetical protein